MISDQVIANCIAEVKEIADVTLAVTDVSGRPIAGDDKIPAPETVRSFSEKNIPL